MNQDVTSVRELLLARLNETEDKRAVLRAPELKQLYGQMGKVSAEERPALGQQINELKNELEKLINKHEAAELSANIGLVDVTAPYDINVPADKRPRLLPTEDGTIHPLSAELGRIMDIFQRMGFNTLESRQLDDDYNMFEALNFPADHPARDDYDTFMTEEGLIAPAHTSTMQNRVLRKYKDDLAEGKNIQAVILGRTFRNEDLDARHEHTFHQFEGVMVGKNINLGNLIATLKMFLSEYYEQDIDVKTQPFYFPFTEPSLEFALSCPFCEKKGCSICSFEGWIELLGCGLIHPNVLKAGGIDPHEYTGFAWGGGIERLVMMKHGIEDIRHFNAGKLTFLRQFTL